MAKIKVVCFFLGHGVVAVVVHCLFQACEVVRPLIQLLGIDKTAIQNFEALMALTNLAAMNDTVRCVNIVTDASFFWSLLLFIVQTHLTLILTGMAVIYANESTCCLWWFSCAKITCVSFPTCAVVYTVSVVFVQYCSFTDVAALLQCFVYCNWYIMTIDWQWWLLLGHE